MVLDSSALMAILFDEADAPAVEQAIERDPVRLLAAATLVEAGVVVEAKLGEEGARELDLALVTMGASVVAVDSVHAQEARLAYRSYGKGRHPAGLNLGDCFTYALAATSGEPVLATVPGFARAGLPTVVLSPPP